MLVVTWADKDLLGATWLKLTARVQLTVLKLIIPSTPWAVTCKWAVQVPVLSTPCLVLLFSYTAHKQEITTWQRHVSCRTIQTCTECTMNTEMKEPHYHRLCPCSVRERENQYLSYVRLSPKTMYTYLSVSLVHLHKSIRTCKQIQALTSSTFKGCSSQ